MYPDEHIDTELADLASNLAGGHYRPVPESDDEHEHDIVQLADDLNLANLAAAERPDDEIAAVLRRFVDRIAEFEESLVEFVPSPKRKAAKS